MREQHKYVCNIGQGILHNEHSLYPPQHPVGSGWHHLQHLHRTTFLSLGSSFSKSCFQALFTILSSALSATTVLIWSRFRPNHPDPHYFSFPQFGEGIIFQYTYLRIDNTQERGECANKRTVQLLVCCRWSEFCPQHTTLAISFKCRASDICP
jgi:hypothetical protein